MTTRKINKNQYEVKRKDGKYKSQIVTVLPNNSLICSCRGGACDHIKAVERTRRITDALISALENDLQVTEKGE